jgi:capsular exopolysaccharide synthesis family protein
MDLVNAHIQVLLSRTRNVNQEEAQRARQFLELQVQQTKEALGQTEDALNKFQQQKGRIRLGTQTELDIVKLSQNENALAEAQASLEVLRARANALRQAINASQAKTANLAADSPAQGGRDSESMLTVLSPEQEAKLREFRAAQERLTRLEARLANLRERYTEAYPLIQVTQDEVAREQANVAQLAKQIPALPVTRDIRDARTGRPAPQAASVERSEAQRQLAALEIEEAAQLAKVETLRLQVDRLRKSLRNLNEEETEFSNLRRNVESQRNLLTVLNDKLMAARIREQGDNGVIRIIDPASFPLQPTRTKTQKLLLMVFGAAFLAALGVAGTIEFVRQPVETEDDVKGIVSFPLLGSVSSFAETAQKKNRKLSAATTALPIQLTEGSVRGSIHTELYRAIRANIEAERLKNPFRSLLVTSAAPGEGKSTTTINLGQVFREFGRRVLIVDADLRRPALHKALSIANSPGLVDLLKGSATLDQVVRSLPGGLAVIPGQATREDPAALLASPRFISLLTEPTAELYDLILLDSAPVLAVPDNLLLAPAVDRVLLVAKSSSTSKRDLLRTSQTLQKVSATVLGVILNEAHHVDVHYYNPRYRKYYTHTPPEAPPQKPNMSKSRLFAWKDKGKGV